MKVNDIYMCNDPSIDAPAQDIIRLVIVREIRGDKVVFSSIADDQPGITNEILKFNRSCFITPIDVFTNFFDFVGIGISAIM